MTAQGAGAGGGGVQKTADPRRIGPSIGRGDDRAKPSRGT